MSIIKTVAMTKKFKNAYNRSSNRAIWWDYCSNGSYFVTICTRDMFHYFGYVYDGKMYLNDLGKCVLVCWFSIPKYYPFVVLDAFIVMPNHIHGIIHIVKNVDESIDYDKTQKRFEPLSGSLGSIVKGFKVGVKKEAKRLEIPFFWKSGYHDHIIKTNVAYQKIANYIVNNPARWSEDRFNNRQ